MARIDGSPQAVSLGEGYAIRAPGIAGRAELLRPRSAAERARGRIANDGSDALDAAFVGAHVTEVRQVEIQVAPSPAVAIARPLRSSDGRQLIELHVPDLGPETGHIVLACDDDGALTWHLPIDDQGAVATPASRGRGGVKRFLVPAAPPPVPSASAPRRGLLGIVGRKLLKVLVYPVTDPVFGAIGAFFAGEWEQKRRPYKIRTFTPADYATADVPSLSTSEWARLGSGRALLFIHGTFSSTHAAFNQLPSAVVETLADRYHGRVFAFDHFTLSHDPSTNVDWFLQHLPNDVALDLDVVCHSRGGLVARELTERRTAHPGADRIRVRNIAFVGVPNSGTLLADPNHMVAMLDRLTTALDLMPSGFITETLEGILTVVKVLGHGALTSLDGLAAMRPDGSFLHELNCQAAAECTYYGVTADFEPSGPFATLIAYRAADQILDRVFEDKSNDLVVPTAGVYDKNGGGNFPIDESHRLSLAADKGVIHTTYFAAPETSQALLRWLTG